LARIMKKPKYTHEFTVGEETEWNNFPNEMVATKENDEWIKIALLDERRIPIVHAEKEAVRKADFETVDEFREYVNWDADWEK